MSDASAATAARARTTPLASDIVIVGLGIVGVQQITREVDEVLRRCREIFIVDSGFGVIDYLKTLCPSVTNLATCYESGKNRLNAYRKMAAHVVSAAATGSTVGFATYGHPRIYCYPTTLIKRAAAILNLRVEVFPGISSLDTVFVDLDFDMATDGLQMYEATDVLLRKRPLQNDVGCLLWQCTTICDPTYPNRPLSAEQVHPLQTYLLRFYPSTHQVAMIMSKTFPLTAPAIRRFPLDRLAVEMAQSPLSGTLYIPPVHARAIQDRELLHKLYPSYARPARPMIGPQAPRRA
jgi:uncharacterized protein YabN with tetrapyrrole methylase and pyrophosphatase domain